MTKKRWLFVILVISFIFRLPLTVTSHHGDLNNNISWGKVAYENGFKGFYEGSKLPIDNEGKPDWEYSAPNQPPLTIYLFRTTNLIWQNLRELFWFMNWELQIFPSKLVWFWDERGMDVMVKLPSLFADIGIGYIIYRYFRKLGKESAGLALSALWLLNPITWYNSSIWGQTDPIVNLLGILAVFNLLDRKIYKFALFYTLSILFKGSLIVFAPVIAVVLIKQGYKFKTLAVTLLISVLTVIVITLPFHPVADLPIWLTDLYFLRILPGEIGFLTANSFNFWWLIDNGKTYDSKIFLGLSARLWGLLISLTFISTVILLIYKRLTRSNVFIALALSALITFLFMTRIHERYLYPYFPFATLYLGYQPHYWPVYMALSLVFLVNQYNLYWAPSIPWLENLLMPQGHGDLLSVLNIIMLFLTVIYVWRKKSIINENEI